MKLRSITLGSAALAGTLFLAAPTFADYHNTNPTAAERAQTERLNNAAADRAHSDADADAAARDSFNAAEGSYLRDRSRFEANQATYDRDRARYDRERARRWIVFYGHDRFMDVAALRSRDLMGLSVSTSGGGRIGSVSDIDTNNFGRITRVAVRTRSGTTWLDTDDLRYDPSRRALVTALTRDEVNGMAHMRYPRF